VLFRSSLDLARFQVGIPVQPEQLDADRMLFSCCNGTINLRTGELHPHLRDDLLTELAPVDFDPAAECPLWDRFLSEIMARDVDLLEFLQRLIGHCLTGRIDEQILLIFHGVGANGKSVFFEVVKAMMGDEYATDAAPDLLVTSRSDRHPTEIADLHGRRLVVAVENEEGRRLRVGFVKQSTGDPTLKGRRMKRDFFEFPRTHKTILVTNHRPRVPDSSHAIWRRIRLVPFKVVIPEERQDK